MPGGVIEAVLYLGESLHTDRIGTFPSNLHRGEPALAPSPTRSGYDGHRYM